MLAAWWWIDRWRKSTAYTDMTAEEQGVYRNLLDECWIRGGVIPADEFALRKISGDPDAWNRVGAKVLKRFKRVSGGWRNETADEVMRQSQRRAKNQKAYRDRSQVSLLPDNAADNAADNGPDNNPASPSPSPSPVSVTRSDSDSGSTERPSGAVAPGTEFWWTRDACDDWNERFGEGTAPGGRIGKGLQVLVGKYGWGVIRPAWQRYLREKDAEYASPQDFASKLKLWLGGRTKGVATDRKIETAKTAISEWVRRSKDAK